MKYTWEDLADSQDFEHGQEFVTAQDHDKAIQTLKVIAYEGYGRPTEMMVAARNTLLELGEIQ